jgi:hypothetical protein
MNITFESKEYPFDDVAFSWYVTSPVNEYRVTISFCGAMQEDGEEMLESSMCADIWIDEIRENNPDILDKVTEKLKKADIEYERNVETIMVCAPDIRESITCRNESDYGSTISDLNTMISALTQTLIEAEVSSVINS